LELREEAQAALCISAANGAETDLIEWELAEAADNFAQAQVTEVNKASHLVYISHSDVVARVIEKAARSIKTD